MTSDACDSGDGAAVTDVAVATAAETIPSIPQQSAEGETGGFLDWLKRKSKLGWAVAVTIGVVLKFKAVLFVVLTKLKFFLVVLKLGKFATTFGSMFLMIYIYAQMYGWAFGVGFVTLILVHEMGHYLTARYLGLNVGVPIFVPFIGAFIALKEMPRDAVMEAKVGLGGPVLGSIGALLCVPVYFMTGSDLFLAIAYVGFMLNLFNLIPVHPLDGGRAATAISPLLWIIGIPVLVVSLLRFSNPILWIMLILGVIRLFEQLRHRDDTYYQVAPWTRLAFAVVYFGLLAGLGIGMTTIHSLHGAAVFPPK